MLLQKLVVLDEPQLQGTCLPATMRATMRAIPSQVVEVDEVESHCDEALGLDGFGGWPYDSPFGDLFPLSGHSDHHPSPFTLHTGFEMILIPPKIFQSLTGGWFQSFLFT